MSEKDELDRIGQLMQVALERTTAESTQPGSRLRWRGNDQRVFQCAADINNTVDELVHVIELVQRARDLHYVRLLLKMYNVGWVTLSDLVAVLINEALDLGYPPANVSLGTILENKHVKALGIPKVVARHSRSVEYEKFKAMRNDIVHRGQFNEPDLEQLRKSEVLLMFEAASEVKTTDKDVLLSAISEKLRGSGFDAKVTLFVTTQAQRLTDHLRNTTRLLTDIDEMLAAHLRAQPAA